MTNKTLICEITDLDFNPKHKMSSIDGYHVRRASRGILINKEKMALPYISKHNYHKFPGGGLEGNETAELAFKREILEETGCNCKILDNSGIIIEYRDKFKLLQISYIFLAKVVGKEGKVNLEKGEIDSGFKLEWVSFSNVEKLLNKDNTGDYEGKFIQIRDKSIFKYYKNKLKTY
jgi:8-oxo-dGTP diphosphatase